MELSNSYIDSQLKPVKSLLLSLTVLIYKFHFLGMSCSEVYAAQTRKLILWKFLFLKFLCNIFKSYKKWNLSVLKKVKLKQWVKSKIMIKVNWNCYVCYKSFDGLIYVTKAFFTHYYRIYIRHCLCFYSILLTLCHMIFIKIFFFFHLKLLNITWRTLKIGNNLKI